MLPSLASKASLSGLLLSFPWCGKSLSQLASKETTLVYKVIQWATGNVGRHSLRGIIQHPELELVGVKTYDPSKAGRDAGELVGLPPAGVTLTADAEEIFALEADCVSYNGLGVTQNDLTQTVSDI